MIPMSETHVSAVADLEKVCFPDPWSENSIRGELNNPLSLWLVAMEEDHLLGYVGSQTVAGESDMLNLAVSPQARRRGIGEALIRTLSERLAEQGSTAILLEVRESNHAAISLYEKMGFFHVGTRPNYYFHPRENAWIMRKELKK